MVFKPQVRVALYVHDVVPTALARVPPFTVICIRLRATLSDAVPLRFTVAVCTVLALVGLEMLIVGGVVSGGVKSKVAVTFRAWLRVTVQVLFAPEQEPPQPMKLEPALAVAVSVTSVLVG